MADQADHFKRLRNVYRAVFIGDNGQPHKAGAEVLANLRELTKYGSSPFTSDVTRLAYQVGMQDVFRHVQLMLNISDGDIYRLTQTSRQQEDDGFYE